jgi:hypothetical protein
VIDIWPDGFSLDESDDPAENDITARFLLLEPDPNELTLSPSSPPPSILTTPSTSELDELGDDDVAEDDTTIPVSPAVRSRIPKDARPPNPLYPDDVPYQKTGARLQRRSGRKWAVAYYRRHKVVEYRMAGVPFREIAQHLGFNSIEGARYAYYRALEDTREASEDLRALELERLDRITQIVWQQVQAGDLEAINTYLKISAVRARVAGFERAPMPNPNPDLMFIPEAETEKIRALENVSEFLQLLPGLALRAQEQVQSGAIDAPIATPMIEGSTIPHPQSNGHKTDS